MITIDGSEGEGGGQVLRHALTLALITGQPCHIDNIRGKRPKPGLMRQHLTAVEAACAIGNATAEGAAVGSTTLSFHPGPVIAGEYHFAVGTAGSTSLVLQTILLPLALATGRSRLVIEGGTHNPQAPPFDFLEATFLPLLSAMGPIIAARLVRPGFYPAGGGRIEIDITPSPLKPTAFSERGALIGVSARAVVAGLPQDIAEREIAAARAVLDWPEEALAVEKVNGQLGPGNVLLLQAQFERVTEVFTGFGQFGISADRIGRQTAVRMAGYLASTAFAGPYLADQLLLPMALAGSGYFTTVKPSQHLLTGVALIRRFLDRDIQVTQQTDGVHGVSIA